MKTKKDFEIFRKELNRLCKKHNIFLMGAYSDPGEFDSKEVKFIMKEGENND